MKLALIPLAIITLCTTVQASTLDKELIDLFEEAVNKAGHKLTIKKCVDFSPKGYVQCFFNENGYTMKVYNYPTRFVISYFFKEKYCHLVPSLDRC